MTCEEFRNLCAEVQSISGKFFPLSRLTEAHRLRAVIDRQRQVAMVELDDGVASLPISMQWTGERRAPWVERAGEQVRTDEDEVHGDLYRMLSDVSERLKTLVEYSRQVASP